MSGDIFLNIDTIVLHGLHQLDRHALAEALQQTLMKQLSSKQELINTDLTRARTNITLPNNFDAEQLGQALGQSLSDIINNNETTASPGLKTTSGR